MSVAPEVTWPTKRASYSYKGYPVGGTSWNPVPGNYVFAKRTENGWLALYAGKTDNFKERFDSHEKLSLAIQRGATHIFVRVNQNAQDRTNEEIDFIEYHKPVLNEQLK